MKIVFLDRDGVINEYPGDRDYVKSWEEFHFLPDVFDALKRLNQSGFKIFIISNQAGVSKGIFSESDLDLITRNMLVEFKKKGIHIDGVYYCKHRNEDNCSCRKPKTGLIKAVFEEFKAKGADLRPQESYFVGDTIRDIETGKAAGLSTIMVFSGKEKPGNWDAWGIAPDFTASDLSEAVDIILS